MAEALDAFSFLQMIHKDDNVIVYGDYITRSEQSHYTVFNSSDYANGCKLNHTAKSKNAPEAAEIFTIRFAEIFNIIEHITDALLQMGEITEQDARLLRTDPWCIRMLRTYKSRRRAQA